MKVELYSYDIYPKVVPSGKTTRITVSPLGVRPFALKEYRVTLEALSDGTPGAFTLSRHNSEYKVSPDDRGRIVIDGIFPIESEYFLRIWDGESRILQLCLYAVDADLFGRMPRIGDSHMHTTRSDGHEEPAVVAANYRATFGYDYLAITDHHRYYPSLEAIAAYKDTDHAMTLVPGEEVHLPGNETHIVNFAGLYSVNALIKDRDQYREVGGDRRFRSYEGADCPDIITEEEFRRQVGELADKLNIPDNVEKYQYAACVWIFNQIKAADGVGVFAHPYWISNLFQISENFTEYMMKTQPFGAFEVLGGERYYEHNGFQTSKYYDDRRKGRDYPIVGATDSHSSLPTNAGRDIARTMVFTPENTRKALVESIKAKYTVAIDCIMPEPRLVGDFRLLKYAWFLLENYFPLHDKIAADDGRLMWEYHFAEDPDVKANYARRIGDCKAEMARLEKKYFAF